MLEQISLEMILLLMAAGFAASFIDSVVGGGGIISVPALMLTGLPTAMVLGTNKLASTFSSLTSSLSFYASGKVDRRTALRLFPLAFIGSCLGSFAITRIPSEFLRPLIVVLLILITVYTLVKKNWGGQTVFSGMSARTLAIVVPLVFVIGFYDGFFGPGTGSFLIFLMVYAGFDFVRASGNSKVLNFGSNAGALILFASLGHVHYVYGLAMGIAMVMGALAGSRVAIRTGVTYVRYLFIAVTVLLIGKQLWDLILDRG